MALGTLGTRGGAPTCPRAAGPGPNCIGYQAAPLSQDEKATILHRHNTYRSQVASGAVPGLPAAASMLQMVSARPTARPYTPRQRDFQC